ncbi:type II secretion system protein C (GspC) [Halopseudomonas xinjiangensis]|uniref:Type II secretion system protein C (GspC) n=1 Tax=Halopseudomonas xinjiangensis TaxID=487184 RepID=A0A1H1UCK2_9GAMM|nr:type II secretion system protein GspC [Halopseudomonas xinjiangensis]SDS70153.1 type II secretion system protein C (GspC) [Halopseudomonas xinjiangensis]
MPLVARLPLDPVLRVITLVLIGLAAVVLGRLVWVLVEPASLLPASDVAAIAVPEESTARDAGGFRELAALSVLGEAQTAGPAVVDAPETNLRWELKGVFTNPDPSRSGAILAPQGQAEKLYRVGAALPGNVRLDQVLQDRVILARDGKLETLRLKRAQAEGGSRSRQRPAASLPQTDSSASLAADGGLARIDRDAWMQDPARFMEVITASPVLQDGQMYGLEVNPARNEREFEAAGLQPGDVIIAVEGTPVSEINDYRDILQELGSASSVSVSLERNGEPMNITIMMD